jgi:hypothetical protein
MIEHGGRHQGHGPRAARLRAYDPNKPDVRERLRREAELVRGHPSTREANARLDELLDEALVGRDPTER